MEAPSAPGDAPPLRPTGVLRQHTNEVHALRFTSAQRLASGDASGRVVLWDLPTRRPALDLPDAHDGCVVVTLRSAARGAELVSQGRDGLVRFWDLQSQSETRAVRTSSAGFCRMSLLEDGGPMLLACTGTNANVPEVWDARADSALGALPPPPGERGGGMCMDTRLLLSAAGRAVLLALFESGELHVYDVAERRHTGLSLRLFEDVALTFDVVCSTRHGAARCRGVAGGAGAELAAFGLDLESMSGEVVRRLALPSAGISSVAVRPDRRVFATGGWDHSARVLHFKRLSHLATLTQHSASVFCVDFAPDSSLLATASKDGRVALWDAYAARETRGAPLS